MNSHFVFRTKNIAHALRRPVIGVAAALALAAPAYAQNDPWDNAVNVLKQAFTGPIATGLSLVAIVVGGLMFAFGEGQSKRVFRRHCFRHWHGHWCRQLHGLALPGISSRANEPGP